MSAPRTGTAHTATRPSGLLAEYTSMRLQTDVGERWPTSACVGLGERVLEGGHNHPRCPRVPDRRPGWLPAGHCLRPRRRWRPALAPPAAAAGSCLAPAAWRLLQPQTAVPGTTRTEGPAPAALFPAQCTQRLTGSGCSSCSLQPSSALFCSTAACLQLGTQQCPVLQGASKD